MTVYSPSISKKKNKLSALQEGPFEVTESDSRGLMFLIKKIGKHKTKGRWVHLDQIKQFKKFLLEEEGEEVAAAKPHSKQYEIEAIVGERGKTRRTKQYRILWEGFDSSTWEPVANLDHANLKIKEWLKHTPGRQQELMSATDEEIITMMRSGDSEAAEIVAIQQQEAVPNNTEEPWESTLCMECAPSKIPSTSNQMKTICSVTNKGGSKETWLQCEHGAVRLIGKRE